MLLKINQLIWLFVFVQLLKAYGDDSVVDITGGGAQLLDEHPSISLIREYVLIETHNFPESYTVTANFTFFNNGDSATVAVGFPVKGALYGRTKDFILFNTWVNDKYTETIDYPIEENENNRVYKYFKVKKVFFPAKSKTTTIVEYKAPYGKYSTGDKWMVYYYGTGSTWHGNIGEAFFDIRFSENNWITPKFYDKNIKADIDIYKRNNGQILYKLNNIEPSLSAGFMLSFDKFDTTDCSGPVIIPWKNWIERVTKDSELNTLSLMQLRLFRNEIFARHGRQFKSNDLQKYFNKKDWYKADTSYTDESLSEIDRLNIKNILYKEKEIKNSSLYEYEFQQ